MMIAGIFIDSFKLATFKKVLGEGGFTFTEHPGLTPGTLLLKVETESATKLMPFVERANKQARN